MPTEPGSKASGRSAVAGATAAGRLRVGKTPALPTARPAWPPSARSVPPSGYATVRRTRQASPSCTPSHGGRQGELCAPREVNGGGANDERPSTSGGGVHSIAMTLRTALKLGRVSNLPTVWTNVLAGVALAAIEPPWKVVLPVGVAASLLYVAGMYLNDAFDQRWDAQHRPERPIPAGEVSARIVFQAGFGMMAAALIVLAVATNARTLVAGLVLAGLILLYDVSHKGNRFAPAVMGLCRVAVYGVAASAAGRVRAARRRGRALPLRLPRPALDHRAPGDDRSQAAAPRGPPHRRDRARRRRAAPRRSGSRGPRSAAWAPSSSRCSGRSASREPSPQTRGRARRPSPGARRSRRRAAGAWGRS